MLLWIGLALLFLCIGVYSWSRSHKPNQAELARELYARDVKADKEGH